MKSKGPEKLNFNIFETTFSLYQFLMETHKKAQIAMATLGGEAIQNEKKTRHEIKTHKMKNSLDGQCQGGGRTRKSI